MTRDTKTSAPPGNAPPAGSAAPSAPPRPRRRRWLRGLLWALGVLVLLVLALAAALWVWSGRDGSLATVLRLAGAQVPLVSENATGSVRRGGKIERLVWDKDGLHVEVRGATLLWQPMALLHGQLQIDELSARSIAVRDERAPSNEPSSGPPQSLSLPLGIEVKAIAADEFTWAGPPEVKAGNLRGHYVYDRMAHQLVIDSLAVMDGSYQGDIKLDVVGKPSLTLDVKGVAASPMPDGQAALPVRAHAQASGPLESMRIKLDVAADPAALAELPADTQAKLAAHREELAKQAEAAEKANGAAGKPRQKEKAKNTAQSGGQADEPRQPSLQAEARVTPWQAPFVPTLSAQFQALDVGAFLAQAPHTGLHGRIEVQPLAAEAPIEEPVAAPTPAASAPASAPATPPASAPAKADGQPPAGAAKPAQHWRVQAQVTNDLPGPLDEQRLPLNELNVDADWRDGLAVVRQLQARLAEGELNTRGQWRQPPPAVMADESADESEKGSMGTSPSENERQHGNTPSQKNAVAVPDLGQWRLVTQLSDINPHAIHSQLDAYPLGGEIEASGEGTRIDFKADVNASTQRTATKSPAKGRTQTSALQALALRELQAEGAWTGSLLQLERLLVRASEAELKGHGSFDPQAQGGQAVMDLSLPGAQLKLDGQMFKDRGQGLLAVQLANFARTQAWLRRLPGMPEAVTAAQAQGSADLKLNWRGGWAQPTVDALLQSPNLRWQPPKTAQADALGVRQLRLALQGGLEKATLSLSGQALQGERVADLKLQAQGGRSTPQRPLAESDWRAQLTQLDADLRDPKLGKEAWRVRLMQSVTAQWQAAQGRQAPALQVSAGQLSLTSPAPAHQALIAWDPLSWRNGQLSTAGRITGLPMAWAEIAAGDAMRQAGVSGDVIFNGSWDAQLGSQLKLQATLARASGDLTVVRKDPATGIESRIAAGLREVRLSLRNEGERVNAQLRWDSAQLGTASGDVNTRLSATRGAQGHTQWAWPETAPLDGQLKLQLPRVNAWSVLAPPGWRIHGSVNADLKIAGTRSQPQLSGNLGADDLAMRSVVDGLEFGGGRLRARLAGQRLLLDEFSLRGAGDQGGQLTATGEAGLVDGAPQARLAIRLQKLRASIRADRQVTVSGQVDAGLEGKLTRVSGQLAVDHALILLPEESAPTLGSDVVVRGAKDIATTRSEQTVAGRSNMAQAAEDDKARKAADKPADTDLQVIADVKLGLGDDFRVRGMGIDTKLTGELTLAANGPITAMPRLTGDVRTVGGTFKAYNQNLEIQRGLIRFTGAIDNPTLDIRAVRPNYTSEQRVGVQVQGTALLPAITLYSNPSLSETETLAWLLLGRAAPENGAEAAMLQSAAMAVLGGREGKSLASRVGLDDLSFGSGNGGTSDASVTLGKRLSNNLYASYERSLSGVTGTLMIYLELSRRWTLRGQAGEDSAVDLLFRISYD